MNSHARAVAAEIDKRLASMGNQTNAPVRELRREFSRRLKGSPAAVVLGVAQSLLKHSDFPYRLMAYELVANHKAALASLHEKELLNLGINLDSWVSVDTFGCYLSGPAWRERQVPDRLIHKWAKSSDRWWRRAALVSTIALNKRGKGEDVERTLAVCRMLVDDRDDMVVKAMSWTLRELGKQNPRAVRDFLEEHEDALAARVLREVRNKLETGLKNPKTKG